MYRTLIKLKKAILNVPKAAPEDLNRRQLLNILLLTFSAGAVVLLIAAYAIPTMTPHYSPEDQSRIAAASLLLLGISLLLFALNRYVKPNIAAPLFLVSFTVIIAISDSPHHVIDGRALFLFAIPILAASALLPAWTSFVFAGLSSSIIIYLSLALEHAAPNISAIIGFFLLATTSYITTQSAGQYALHLQRAHQALKKSEKRFRNAITEAPYPIMLHAEDGQVLRINKAWTAITGYSQQDIPTIEDWTRNAYGSKKDIVQSDIEQLYILNGPKSEGEYTITTKSGAQRVWQFSSAPLGELPDGRRLAISIAMDITKRKQTEEEIQKHRDHLEDMVAERTTEMRKMINLMAGREVRMAEMKEVIQALRAQLIDAGLTPVADDPLSE